MPRTFILASSLEKIKERFHTAVSSSAIVLPASYNLSAGDITYVITSEQPHELQTMQFGMTPYFAKKAMDLINARAEGDKNPGNDPLYSGPNQIFLKRAFKKPLQIQRCLVIADAYYDFSGAKMPYLFYLQDKQRPFAMAGLYDYWQNPETKEIIKSFSIITISANSMLQAIGIKRMPVIITPGYERDWIKADRPLSDVLHMLRRFPPEKMNGYPVSDLINTPGVNEASLINPVGERLQSEVKPEIRLTPNNRYYHKKRELPSGSWGESRQSGH